MIAPDAAADRPLGLSPRRGLTVRPAGRRGVIVTDPLSGASTEISHEDWAIIGWLQPEATLRGLRRRHDAQFAPRRLRDAELLTRLASLRAAGLVVGAAAGQGDALWRDHRDAQRRWLRWAWAQALVVRLPGVDPAPVVAPLDRALGWLYSDAGLAALACFWLVGLGAILGRLDRFVAQTPAAAALFTPGGFAIAAAVLVTLKGVHELGHAVACRRRGAQPREIGLMLVVGAPAPYCDVSDAWRLPRVADRAVVSLGGVAAELTAAAAAALVWRASDPGPVAAAAMLVVLAAGAGALLVNLNPLVRFDGYYLLSDLTATPNLWSRSREALKERLAGAFAERPKQAREPIWLAIYGAASAMYMWILLFTLGWGALAIARRAQVEPLGWFVAALTLAAACGPAALGLSRAATNPRGPSLRRSRVGLGAACAVVVLGLVGSIPVERRVAARARVVPADGRVVAVTTAGRIVETARAGQLVAAGDVLARLESSDIAWELAAAVADREALRSEVDLLRRARSSEPGVAMLLPAAEQRALAAEARLAELLDQQQRLTLRAPVAGVVLPAPPKRGPDAAGARLPGWEGDPLDAENTGAWLEVGDALCVVAPRDAVEVELLVDDADGEGLAPGERARIALAQLPGEVLRGRLTDVASSAEPGPRDSLAALLEPAATLRARARLEGDAAVVAMGGWGRARIDAGRTTVAARAIASLRRALTLP